MKTLLYETVVLAPSFQARLLEHAQTNFPKECCGIVGGRKNVITSVYPLTNDLDSPCEYRANEGELFEAVRKMRENGEEMLGIYHSHPNENSEPSEKDRDQNHYPGHFYFIVSFPDPESPQITCHVMEDDKKFYKVQIV